MLEKLTDNKSIDLDLHLINDTITELEIILSKHDIQNDSNFKDWVKDFKKIYGNKEANLKLYLGFALIYFVSLDFVAKNILKKNNQLSNQSNFFLKLKGLEVEIKSKYVNLKIIDFTYFTPIISLAEKEDLESFGMVIYEISDSIFNTVLKPEFVFDYLFQMIISPIFLILAL